jgi:RHS repeat-associated protein
MLQYLRSAGRAWPRATWPLLLLCTPLLAVAQTPADAYNYARTVSIERDPVTGFVMAEVLQPDHPQLCLRTEYSYDAYGNRRVVLQRHCASTTGVAQITPREVKAEFTAEGETPAGLAPTVVTNAEGHVERREVDTRYGGLKRLQDANGLVTRVSYDDFGRKVLETKPDGNYTNWSYGICPAVGGAAMCDQVPGAVVAYYAELRPEDASRNVNGPVTRVYFDTEGREVRSQTIAFHMGSSRRSLVVREYDSLGRQKKLVGPYFEFDPPAEQINWEHDVLGRTTAEIRVNPNAAGGVSRSTTEYRGRVVKETNALERTRTKEHDEFGRVIRVTDAQGNQSSYQHDAFGNLAVMRDPMGNLTQIGYDLLGRKVSLDDPDMGKWSYRHDVLGQLKEQTNARGQLTELTYDRLGRMTRRYESDLDSRWYFDRTAAAASCGASVGRLCEATTSTGYRRLNTFDSLSRPVKTSTTLASGANSTYVSKLTYDSNGRVDQQVWPTGLGVRHIYNTDGVLLEMRNAATSALYWQRVENNARGQIVRSVTGNGLTQRTTWQPETGLATAMQVGTSSASGSVVNLGYAYNALHNLTTRSDVIASVNETFQYDRLNRLTLQELTAAAGNRSVAYHYDALGNIKYHSEIGLYDYTPEAGETVARPHAVRRITGFAGKLTNPQYKYDPNGNLVSVTGANGVTRTNAWTSFDMPQSLSLSSRGVSSTFLYGPEHQRIRQVTTRDGQSRTTHYLHPDNAGGLFFEREEQGTGGVATNRHFLSVAGGAFLQLETPGALQADPVATNLTGVQLRYLHKDHLGSVVAITEGTGAVMERLAYEPFGKRRQADGQQDATGNVDAVRTKRGFTGHEHLDELDYVHMNGRVYDPDIGRFASADPTVPHAHDLQGLNRYAYVRNNPLNSVDPSGFEDSGSNDGGSGGGGSNQGDGANGVASDGKTAGASGSLATGTAKGASQTVTEGGVTFTITYDYPTTSRVNITATRGLAPSGVATTGVISAGGSAAAAAPRPTIPPIDWKDLKNGLIGFGRNAIGATVTIATVGIWGPVWASIGNPNNGSAEADSDALNVAPGTDTKGTPDDPDGDGKDKGVPGDNKQFGKKFGEHRDPNRPGYRTPQEYRELADKLYNDPKADRVTFGKDAARYAGETHITDSSGNLLRLDPQGNFRSLYPIK